MAAETRGRQSNRWAPGGRTGADRAPQPRTAQHTCWAARAQRPVCARGGDSLPFSRRSRNGVELLFGRRRSRAKHQGRRLLQTR